MDLSGESFPVHEPDAELAGAYGELTPFVQDLVPHSKSHSLESLGGFDLGDGEAVGAHSDDLIGHIIGGNQVSSPVAEAMMDQATVDFFASFGPFNCPSIYSKVVTLFIRRMQPI